MKKANKYAIIGLKALQRAAQKVADDARRNNYKIPIWINGRIVHKIPGMITEQGASVDNCPTQAGSGIGRRDTCSETDQEAIKTGSGLDRGSSG